MNLNPRTDKTFLPEEDLRWVAPGGQEQLRDADSITIDFALFNIAGQFTNGLIPSGVVLAKKTATGFYGPYTPGAADGTQNALGHLRASIPVPAGITTGKSGAALAWHGEVIESLLPVASGQPGGLDATAKAALTRFRYI